MNRGVNLITIYDTESGVNFADRMKKLTPQFIAVKQSQRLTPGFIPVIKSHPHHPLTVSTVYDVFFIIKCIAFSLGTCSVHLYPNDLRSKFKKRFSPFPKITGD